MSGAFTAIDLAQLQAPDIIEAIDYETVLADMKSALTALSPELEATLQLESDPLTKLLEVCAYRETLLRQRVNEAAKAVMLAYAGAADLEQLAANYNVERLLISPGDENAVPPVPPVYEDDTSLRRRVQLAFEGLSTAGPEGAYVFHALGADADVLDASAVSPTPGVVVVTILSRTGDGTASQELLDAAFNTLSADEVRPLTDQVSVQSAELLTYSIDASLTLYPGPDSAVVLQAAEQALADYIDRNHRLGRDVTLSGIYAALHQEGVQNVSLITPVADIVVASHQAAYCTASSVTIGGIGE